jgi:hypothetical protein
MRGRFMAVVAAAGVAACFGAGPIPSPPTDATIVFSIAPSMNDSTTCTSYYVGDVAIGSDAGYAITVPYKPQDCGGGGTLPQGLVQPVFRFAKTGGATMIGSAGPSVPTSEPRIAVTAAGPAWAYPVMGQTNTLQIDPAGTVINFGQATSGPTFSAAALVGLADTLYVAAAPPANVSPDDPSFPCCGGMQGNNGGTGAIQTSPAGMIHVNPPLVCGETSHCLAVNTDNIYYFDQPTGSTGVTAAVEQTTKAGATTKIGDIGMTSGLTTPVGIAADDATVVWATSVLFTSTSNNLPRGCVLTKYQAGATMLLFTTQQFSCSDVALDGTHAYFTIVSIEGNDSNNQSMNGAGIGRVELATGTVETLALGIIGPQAGPRRVYADGADLYLVDPNVIGKIAKTALDGQHDFAL